MKNNTVTVSLSRQSFFKAILFVVIALLLIYIRYLLLTLIISFILASFTKYFAQSLQKNYKLPYKYGLFSIFILLIIVFIFGFAQLLPLLIREGYGLFETISLFVKKFEGWLLFIGLPVDRIDISQFSSLIPNFGKITVGVLGVLGQVLTYTLLIFVLAFYISINETGINKIVQIFVPESAKDYVPGIIKDLEYHIGKWAFVEAGVALIMSIFIYTITSILGFKYAAILAILAGVSQLVPILGPFLIMSIIIIYAFLQGPLLGLITLVLIFVLMIIKKFLLLPVIFSYKKSINTLLIIFALMIGGILAGTLGVFIAMPVVSLAKIIYKDIKFYDR